MTVRARRSVLALIFAAMLIFASCGSDGSDDAADTTVTTVDTEATAPSGDGPEGADDGPGGTDDGPEGTDDGPAGGDPTSTTVESTTTAPATGGGSASDFCATLARFDDLDAADGEDLADNWDELTDAERLKLEMTTMADAFREIENSAPAEIRDDVATMRGLIDEMIALYTEHDFDAASIMGSPEAMARLQQLSDSEVEQVADRLGDYTERNCDFD